MTVGGVIFDFHRTLVVAASLGTWLRQAAERVGEQDSTPDGILPVLRSVWDRAGKRYPDTRWDLNPALHRAVFEEVLTSESACSPELAGGLYDTMADHWIAVPGGIELLAALRARDLRVGLLSNIAIDIRARLTQLGLLQHLDVVVLSFEEGMVKPDPRIFILAAERLGLEPRECLYVGDDPRSDAGAVAAGMPCLLVPVIDDAPQLELVAALLSKI